MNVGSLSKSVYEKVNVSVNFTPRVASGNTIALGSVTATDQTGAVATTALIATNPAPAVSGLFVTFQLTGGTVGFVYTVSVKVTSSPDGQAFEGSILVPVTAN